VLEALDDRIRTAADIEQATGLAVVGTLRRDPGDKVLLTSSVGSRLAESFRALYANLGFAGPKAPLSTIVVTSAIADEGKTTVSINLAITLALASKRVLLVDADLHHPTIHERLGLGNEAGLAQCLLEEKQGQEELLAFLKMPTIPNLLVLTSGPMAPYSTALLDSVQMRRLLESVLPGEGQPGLVDVVVLDTPPVMESSDAVALTARASAVLLVVDAKRSRRDQLVRAHEALTRVSAHAVGAVLNRVKLKGENKFYRRRMVQRAGSKRPAVFASGEVARARENRAPGAHVEPGATRE
jgi:capsular exopolysaccharide synthesis family protein